MIVDDAADTAQATVRGPVSDAEFIELVRAGKPLPEDITPKQKEYYERYSSSSAGRAAADSRGPSEEAAVDAPDADAERSEEEPDDEPGGAQVTGVTEVREVEIPVFNDDDEEEEPPKATAVDSDVQLPPFELSSKNRTSQVVQATPVASAPHRLPNDLGLLVSEEDDCFHHNKSWKGGCCTIQGNRACGFQGGNQQSCTFYKDMETGKAESRRGRF